MPLVRRGKEPGIYRTDEGVDVDRAGFVDGYELCGAHTRVLRVGRGTRAVTAANSGEARACALDGYLALREADGYRGRNAKRRAGGHLPPPSLLFPSSLVRARRGQRRLVVSVDEHGDVTTVAAEPERW